MPECSPRRSEERFSRNAETDIYTLSLHDALPISEVVIADLLPQTLDPAPNIRLLRHARIIRNARMLPKEIGRAVQQECRDRYLHSFPTRRSSDLGGCDSGPAPADPRSCPEHPSSPSRANYT